jgi:hypothetical protein
MPLDKKIFMSPIHNLLNILLAMVEQAVPKRRNSVDGKRTTERLLKDGISVKTSKKRIFFLNDGNSKKNIYFFKSH